MSEFASQAMMRVLERGLHELGIRPSRSQSQVPHTLLKGATVDLDAKRELLMHAIREGGVQCLVQLGRGVHHFSDEPTHRAMTSARTPIGLLQRWQRLEKYIHSLHRVELLDGNEEHLSLAHRSKRTGMGPSLPESLVVVGVLASLLEAMGAIDVTVSKQGITVYPELLEKDIARQGLKDQVSAWVFGWAAIEKGAEGQTDPSPTNLFDGSEWPSLAKQVGNACVNELISAPTLATVAQGLATSSRSLQRRLAESGFGYSQLLGEARRRMAAWRLIETTGSLSEIGFFSGYADQAHFTRDFRASVGLTPAQYRHEFRREVAARS